MASDNPQAVLSEEILADARRQAERVINRARAEAEHILAAARAEAQAETERSLASARARGARRAQMILASTELEVARRKLAARQEILDAALAAARDQLLALTGADYRRVIVALAAEAIRGLPADLVGTAPIRVSVGVASGEMLDVAGLAGEIAVAAARPELQAQIAITPAVGAPRGVVIEAADGRIRWDNTFAARLRRNRAALNRLLAPILFAEP